MQETPKATRGGARKGAGRKPTGRLKQFANTTISGTPDEIATLKALAASASKSVSRYVLDTLLQK